MNCFFFNLFRVLELHNKHQNKFRHKNLYSFTFLTKIWKKRANARVLPVCTRMYPCVTGMLLVCTRMLLVCTCMYLYVTRMYSYVLVWCFTHDPQKARRCDGLYSHVTQLYSHQIRTANQIRRSYKNAQSNIFVTVYWVTRKYNHAMSVQSKEANFRVRPL